MSTRTFDEVKRILEADERFANVFPETRLELFDDIKAVIASPIRFSSFADELISQWHQLSSDIHTIIANELNGNEKTSWDIPVLLRNLPAHIARWESKDVATTKIVQEAERKLADLVNAYEELNTQRLQPLNDAKRFFHAAIDRASHLKMLLQLRRSVAMALETYSPTIGRYPSPIDAIDKAIEQNEAARHDTIFKSLQIAVEQTDAIREQLGVLDQSITQLRSVVTKLDNKHAARVAEQQANEERKRKEKQRARENRDYTGVVFWSIVGGFIFFIILAIANCSRQEANSSTRRENLAKVEVKVRLEAGQKRWHANKVGLKYTDRLGELFRKSNGYWHEDTRVFEVVKTTPEYLEAKRISINDKPIEEEIIHIDHKGRFHYTANCSDWQAKTGHCPGGNINLAAPIDVNDLQTKSN